MKIADKKGPVNKKQSVVYANMEGQILPYAAKAIPKRWRDLLSFTLGTYTVPESKKLITFFDPADPLGGTKLKGDPDNPLCKQCALYDTGCQNPFLTARGSKRPLLTVIYEEVSYKEDTKGKLASGGGANYIYELLRANYDLTGIDPEKDVRWLATTLCASRSKPNLKTKGNWCRYFAVQDLMMHPPKLIMPVGTTVLGLLSHKSNAQDWQGKILTYRGWPDDWLIDPDFALPKINPLTGEKDFIGHPIFGPVPDIRIPMFPIQSNRIIQYARSQEVTDDWKAMIVRGASLAKQELKIPKYTKDWYNYTRDPAEVHACLQELIDNPGTFLAFDTETTGLKPWLGDKVTIMMFRWTDKHGNNRSVGFPWDYPESPLLPFLGKLKPQVQKAVSSSVVVGHNLAFDMQFLVSSLGITGNEMDEVIDAGKYDTWHMAYTYKQRRGSLGLEVLAYTYAPDLAGYEEDFVLLSELHSELLHPAGGKGGHYALCPEDKVQSHLVPYVMGDVEVTYAACQSIARRLDSAHNYLNMPLADPTNPGEFREFAPPNRSWVYHNIISPANVLLTKMMSRGMHVNVERLDWFEKRYPTLIVSHRKDVMEKIPSVKAWADLKMNTVPDWEFDLENKGLLKELLFSDACLGLPVQRITKSGKKKFGDKPEDIERMTKAERYEYAAVDKFTLNKLAADYPEVRPLQDYRKAYKLYTTYVKPMRNFSHSSVDKKVRVSTPHLCPDGRIHTSFKLTGTIGGRLSSSNPNLQQLPNDADIKDMFTSRFGSRGCIYAGDLSQIELRLLAAACGDPSMVKAYHDDIDLHTLTTSRIFKLDYEMFSKPYMEKLQSEGRGKEAKDLELKRKVGKTCNFLTGYGGGSLGLQTALANNKIYMDIEECNHILAQFFESYPALKRFLAAYKFFVENNGVAVSITGRVRVFDEVRGDDQEAKAKALRAGCNHLIQATASDIMLTCLVAIEGAMRAQNLESVLVSTVHDSLVIDAVKEELPQVHAIVYYVLNNIPQVIGELFGDDFDVSWITVPLAGDCDVGLSYGHMNKIPTKGEIDWDKLLEPEEEWASILSS